MSTYSDRIMMRMKELDLSQGEVAKATGAARSTVHGWLNNVAQPSGQRLLKLATILKTSAEWILNGKDSPQNQGMGSISQGQSQGLQWPAIADLPARHDGLPPSKQTPVISWVQAGDYTEVLSGDLSHVIEWIPYNPKAGKHGFALIVKGRSMEPMFNPDDRIYVNPTFQIDELHTGALVVMSCNGDEEATFKELVVEDGEYYLRPLNPNWHKQIIPIDGNCRLVGKVVGKFVIYD